MCEFSFCFLGSTKFNEPSALFVLTPMKNTTMKMQAHYTTFNQEYGSIIQIILPECNLLVSVEIRKKQSDIFLRKII